MQLKVGCDPEVFLRDPVEGFVSAHGLLPGTKSEPHKVEKGAVQVDGLAFEFNIDPVSSEDEFVKNINTVLAQMNEMVKNISKDMEIVFTPFARFDVEYFDLLPDDCKILGCDPDVDYLGNVKSPDPELALRPFRTAAGHVHIGWIDPQEEEIDPWDQGHMTDCMVVTKLFMPQQFFSARTKEENDRVQYYGSGGSFRPKVYGVELRSPSNLWVKEEIDQRKIYQIITSRMNFLENKGA